MLWGFCVLGAKSSDSNCSSTWLSQNPPSSHFQKHFLSALGASSIPAGMWEPRALSAACSAAVPAAPGAAGESGVATPWGKGESGELPAFRASCWLWRGRWCGCWEQQHGGHALGFLSEFPKSVEMLRSISCWMSCFAYSFSAGEHLVSFTVCGTGTGYSSSNCHLFLYQHLGNLLISHLV